MFFTYDMYKNIQAPEVYLAYKDKRYICAVQAYELKCKPRFASMSAASFKIYRFENGEEVPYWDKLQIGLLIEVRYVSWFTVSDINLDKSEDGNEYMEISLQSLENETCQTYLTSFGSLGTDLDNQGGLDRYCLYNELDKEHSIMHIFHQKNPGWKIGHIDPDISAQYRSFTEDSVVSYEFLTDKVAQVYECVFIFDVYERSVNAFKLENIGKTTSIFLSDRNLIKSVHVQSDDSNIKTVFHVSGGNDSRTNTTLTIADVNPSGNTSISNFSYYYPQMSAELVDKLNEYSRLYEQNEPLYSSALLSLENLYAELNTLKHSVPENHDTTDFTQLGLAELQERESEYKQVMSVYVNDYKNDEYTKARSLRERVLTEISIRENQITAKEQEIENQITIINSYMVNIQDILGDRLYEELSYFVREQDFQDDSFIATAEMTQEEILEMQKELMAHAQKELARVSYPQFEMTINVINFTAIGDFDKFTEQLELGNIITVEWEPGVLIEARILGMNLDFDNPDNFEIVISNKNSLDEIWSLLAEIRSQAGSTASSVDYNKGAWNAAKNTSLDFRQFMNSIFDASLQKLQNSSNQEVLMDETGIILRKWLVDQNKYSPNQVWMTNGQIAFSSDGWENVRMALGELYFPDGSKGYGLIGDYLIGNVVIGEHLHLTGSAAEITLGENPDFNNLKVSVDEFKVQYKNDIEGVNAAIAVNSNNIALKVDKNSVISAINLSPETVRIEGKKIQLDGEVAFGNSKLSLNAGNTTINGGCIESGSLSASTIKGGTLDAGKANIVNLNASNITTGSFNASLITAGTLDASKITVSNLVVGSNVSMGSNAKISWKQVTGTGNVATLDDVPDDDYITEITRDTITTSYINSLNVTARYVEASGIKAGTINGVSLNFDSSNSVFWTTDDHSWTCDSNAIYSSGHDTVIYSDGNIEVSNSIEIANSYSWFIKSNCMTTNGDIWSYGDIWADADMYCQCIHYSSYNDTYSDRRLKTSITEIDYEKISNFIFSLKPSCYNMMYGDPDKLQYGLIAQEVVDSCDRFDISANNCFYNIDKDGYYRVSYTAFIAPIIATIKYQQEQINKLNLMVNKLSQ